MPKAALIVVDAQNDFCDPFGSLYVRGAKESMQRLSSFIHSVPDLFDDIYCTLDMHHVFDVGHSSFWVDAEGKHPDPDTEISHEDIVARKMVPSVEANYAWIKFYSQQLEWLGKHKIRIWPEHCVIGTSGAAMVPNVREAIMDWERKMQKNVIYLMKGMNPICEHYSAFEAEVPDPNDRTTQFDQKMNDKLASYGLLVWAGQALDYCVASTMRTTLQRFPHRDIRERSVLLTDCTDAIQAYDGEKTIEELRSLGVKCVSSVGMSEFLKSL